MSTAAKKTKYQCETCSQSFNRAGRLETHTKKCGGSIHCTTCNKSFRDIRALQRHREKASTISCNHCSRLFCNENDYHTHQRSIPRPLSRDPVYEFDIPILPETGYESTSDYKFEVNKHRNAIRDQALRRKRYTVVNKQLTPEFTYRDLHQLLKDVVGKESCKLNLGFGFVLYNTVEKVYKYYYVSSNHLLFERAFTISTGADITKFFQKIVDLDLINNYYLKKPSSSWVLVGIPNVEIFMYPLKDIPIGTGQTLPEYLKNARSIISLTHDENNRHPFDDNKCFWRCLALHRGASVHALERTTNALMMEFEGKTNTSFEHGVEINVIPAIEIHFKTSINVYSLQQDKIAKALQLSKMDYRSTLHINLYENHFSYIKDFKKFAKKYTCEKCQRIMNDSSNLKRHAKECSVETEEWYVGGKYRTKKNIFELLDAEGLKIPQALRHYPYFSVFDMESMQKRIDEDVNGRNFCFEHVPATGSICSNIPGHENAVHYVSKGDPQQLVDSMIEGLLVHAEHASKLCRQRYAVWIEIMEKEVQRMQGILKPTSVPDDVDMDVDDESDTEDEESDIEPVKETACESFIIDQSDDRSQTKDDSDENTDDEDLSEFIDDDIDGDGEEEDDTSFYRRFDNDNTTVNPTRVVGMDTEGFERKLKKYKQLLSKLNTYCDQLIIFGFNSQRYDIPLIKKYLPSSLTRLDSLPRFVIKKGSGYMVIASKRLKFLDITNYLAAGISLEALYKSYNVSTAKGKFPYEWFDSLDKLKEIALPPIGTFYSTLTNKGIEPDEYDECLRVWNEMPIKDDVSTFADYIRYYNDHDVIGLVEAIDKMLAIEVENNLDPFKDAISLPGLTQRYLFNNLLKDEYFVGFGHEHKYLYKIFRENIVGGPSIIFHRHQEANVTKIKNGDMCKKVIGFDANSLYLWCLAQEMPTGHYSVREKKNNFVKQIRYSDEAIQWLEHMARKNDITIRHAKNSPLGEMRIDNLYVDGIHEESKTVYEYYGCFVHGHSCTPKSDTSKWQRTLDREDELRRLGYTVVSITSCQWFKEEDSKVWYDVSNQHDVCTMEDIIDAVCKDEIFGFVRCSIQVPEHLKDIFSEFPPIFKNTEIRLQDIGEHMQAYCRSISRKHCVKRSLIGSMYGEDVLLLTPLLKKYLQMGLVVSDISLVVEYNGKPVFEWFMNQVCDDRRRADLDPTYTVRGETSKTKGNCGYGATITDRTKHTATTFAYEKNVPIHVSNPLFKTMSEMNDDFYEIEKQKRKIKLDLPIQIGLAVYSYAKLRMIEFWEFINSFLMNDLYQLMEMDTDSLYIAFARENIDDCVKLERREEWFTQKWKWFSSTDNTSTIEFDGKTIPFAQWDKRTPGKFKPEFVGDGMGCLNSKVYVIWGINAEGQFVSKTSAKGTQKKRNAYVREHFLNVLKSQKPQKCANAGFMKTDGTIKTYTQTKQGLGYFYVKRKVLEDGVSTTHLDI